MPAAKPILNHRAFSQPSHSSHHMHPGKSITALASVAMALLLPPFSNAQNANTPDRSTPWADWVEPDFPFFSSILDARELGEGFPEGNLAPRGIVLNLGNDCWACFDPDLLRISAIWQGKGVTPDALAPKSYHPWGTKTQGGQKVLPKPDGTVWIANGIYPGWQLGERFSLNDPRSPAPSQEEVGRGPIPETMGRFQAVRLTSDGVVLEYNAGGVEVREQIVASLRGGRPVVERHLEIGPSRSPLILALGSGPMAGLSINLSQRAAGAKVSQEQGTWIARIPARQKATALCIALTESGKAPSIAPRKLTSTPPATRWPGEATTQGRLSEGEGAFVVDEIPLPHNNPWRRNVRPADIQFLKDGTGIAVTLDGDVWRIEGLKKNLKNIRWKRFASGLHEPMTAAIRDDQLYVFDRNGIWRLLDTDGNGEADVHELFSNAFAQTADMREFPSTIRLAPKGEFIIAKGGQQASTLGKHNGSVLRVSADGKRSTVLGYGFRQPSIGVNPRTGLVTSSDQEGQYIPSTPLHIVRDHQYYGYLADGLQEREQYPAPIAEPLTWIPHAVNASATSQLWLYGAKMGPLNDAFVSIAFNKPEVLKVLLNERGPELEAAVISVATGFDFPPLNGSLNPVDGQLYLAGLQINGWGNGLYKLAGMGRVRYTGAEATLPQEIAVMDKGVLLRFDTPLDEAQARNPDSYSLASWHYKRTYRYGSAQYKANGEHGIDWLSPSSAYLSKDKRSVFVGVPDMKPVMQLRVGWSLRTASGKNFEQNAYTTPRALPPFDPAAEGFGAIEVDLSPRERVVQESSPVTLEEGERLYRLMGCVACHQTGGDDIAKIGPGWAGLYGSEREVIVEKKRMTLTVDEAYLRESILDPSAKAVRGFERGEYAMPSYAGVLNEEQIQSLILFIKSL